MKHISLCFLLLFILCSVSGFAAGPTSFDNGWIKITQISKDVYHFEENYADCYLVIGKTQAVLIDAVYGGSDLQKLCGEFTQLPVTVIDTHGHHDHVGGDQYFSSVMIHQDDVHFLEAMITPEAHDRMYGIHNSPNFPKNFDITKWYDSPVKPTRLLSGGEVLEFGDDIKLEVIATPGHTAGSICLLDRQRRLLFTGDTFLFGMMWMQLPESDFQEWLNSAEKIAKLRPVAQKVLPGHSQLMYNDSLDALGVAVADIRAGKDRKSEVDNPLGGKCYRSQSPRYPYINVLHQ